MAAVAEDVYKRQHIRRAIGVGRDVGDVHVVAHVHTAHRVGDRQDVLRRCV